MPLFGHLEGTGPTIRRVSENPWMPYQARRLLDKVQQNLESLEGQYQALEENVQTLRDVRGNLLLIDFAAKLAADEPADRDDILQVSRKMAELVTQARQVYAELLTAPQTCDQLLSDLHKVIELIEAG